jgi:hypothetical protein
MIESCTRLANPQDQYLKRKDLKTNQSRMDKGAVTAGRWRFWGTVGLAPLVTVRYNERITFNIRVCPGSNIHHLISAKKIHSANLEAGRRGTAATSGEIS